MYIVDSLILQPFYFEHFPSMIVKNTHTLKQNVKPHIHKIQHVYEFQGY